MALLGRYETMDKLGTGSMGTVFRARDTLLEREVALKVIRTGSDIEPELRERFYREARACGRLQHPAIVAVFDLGEIDNVAWIAMELLEGRDLRKVTDQRLRLPLSIKLEVMAQVCDALSHAHKHGIIHRDIKPSNLFLVEDRRAKVLDFGIARLPSSRLTVANKILGTPNYMAPEQILGKPVDTRSDLFSAAVVFFELLVFAHPFHAQNIPDRIIRGEPDSLFDHDAKLPVLLERILSRGLSQDPTKRYQTGDEFAADLRAVADAVRQDASPTFSRIELPSEREFPTLPMAPQTVDAGGVLLRPPPLGEDPHEWRLSEVLRLIPEFEYAVDRRDSTQATQLFRQLEAIEAVDHRFGEALQLCRVSLSSVSQPAEAQPATAYPPQKYDVASERSSSGTASQSGSASLGVISEDQVIVHAPDEEPRSVAHGQSVGFTASSPEEVACPGCGSYNRVGAQYCSECGMHLFAAAESEHGQQSDASSERSAPFDFDRTLIPHVLPERGDTGAQRHSAPSSDATAPSPASIRHESALVSVARRLERLWVSLNSEAQRLDRRQTWIIMAGAIACIVALLFAVFELWPVRIERALATARVRSDQAVVYRGPDAGTRIITLSRDDAVNILRLPKQRDQNWTSVQFVGRRVVPPGYIRTRELSGWTSSAPDTALGLIVMFYTSEAEYKALLGLSDRYPGTHAAFAAQLEMARLDLTAAREMYSEGSADLVQARLSSARERLGAAGADVTLKPDVDEVRRGINELAAQMAPPPPSPQAANEAVTPRPSDEQLARFIHEAETSKENGQYEQAEKYVQRVLRRQPDNKKALELQDSIRKAQAAVQQMTQ